MTQLPIFHINGDDPEAAYRALQIALDYRQEINKDVVLDVVGFRKLGHNETDEPSYTQPLMYARVKAHPGVRAIYSQRLIKEGVITEAELQELIAEQVRRYRMRWRAPGKSLPKSGARGVVIVEEWMALPWSRLRPLLT